MSIKKQANQHDSVSHVSRIDWRLKTHQLLFFIILCLFFGTPVPFCNEFRYLVLPLTLYDSSYLANNWLLTESWRSHYFFDLFFGFFIHKFSIETVGWFGRLICWYISTIGLYRIGKSLQLPLWMTTVSLILWLTAGQVIIAGEWLFYSFEAKCIAYIFIFFALDALINKRNNRAAILLGLSFCTHPTVGFFAILAIGCTVIVRQYPARKNLSFVFLTFLFCLPALCILVPDMMAEDFLTTADYQFIVTNLMPFHLDPMTWPKRDFFTQLLIFTFMCAYFRKTVDNQALKVYFCFTAFLFLFFLGGLILYFLNLYSFLISMPFRHFPLFSLLFFFFFLFHAFHNFSDKTKQIGPVVLITGALSLMCMPNPIARTSDMVRTTVASWHEPDDIAKSYIWISQNTPEGSIVVSPPWRRDTWYLTERAQATSIRDLYPYDNRFKQWTERMRIIAGPQKLYPNFDGKLEQSYNNLTKGKVFQ